MKKNKEILLIPILEFSPVPSSEKVIDDFLDSLARKISNESKEEKEEGQIKK